MMSARTLTAFLACAAAGCTSMSGLDARSDFACKAPKGVSCASITAVHANANAGVLPAQQRGGEREDAKEPVPAPSGARPRAPEVVYATSAPLPTAAATAPGAMLGVSPTVMNAPATGMPLRTPERILRVWVAPFEDVDGDFHDQRYIYVSVSRGQWTVDRARAAIRNQYQLVRPLSKDKEPEAPAPQPQLPLVPNAPPASQ